MKKTFLLLVSLLLLCGCNKAKGTWCRYIQTYSVYGIVRDDISEEEKQQVFSYFDTVEDMKSYDYLDDVEDAKGMFIIYLKDDTHTREVKGALEKFAFIYEAGLRDIESKEEELIIGNKEFTYKYNLTESNSSSYEGTYKIEDNTIKTNVDSLRFYLKDDYLCKEFTCNTIYVKSKNKTCD